MLKLLPSPAAALSLAGTKLIFPQCPFSWHVCQCIDSLHFSRHSTVALSLSSLLDLLSSITPTLSQPPSSSLISKWIYYFLTVNLTSHQSLPFNILLCYLKADVIPRFTPLLLLIAMSCVPFFALLMPFTSTVLTFLNSYPHYVSIAPSALCQCVVLGFKLLRT